MSSYRIVAAIVAAVISIPALAYAQSQDAPEKVYKVGHNITPPHVIYAPEPEFSEKARRAGYQGTCTLSLVVGTDGKTRDIKVITPIGMGLDEEAVAAVQTWRFNPALRDGEPVSVTIAVEVDFHLYGTPNTSLAKLMQKAQAGDPKAQLDLANKYFDGRNFPQNETLAMDYLKKAANQGLPRAQFLMGEHLAHNAAPDYAAAYKWYTLAQRSGDKHSSKALKELSAKMTPEQLQTGQAQAASWTPTPTQVNHLRRSASGAIPRFQLSTDLSFRHASEASKEEPALRCAYRGGESRVLKIRVVDFFAK